jgi:adenylylsulfate kinase-like enzyme
MITVLFGQPHSGKTTLSHELESWTLDGDKLRAVFQDKDFSREGRIKNLNRASDIAVFMHSIYKNISIAMVYPYKEARDYLNNLCTKLGVEIVWVHLYYSEQRGREAFHVQDFELDLLEENVLSLNTSMYSIEECIAQIKNYTNEYSSKR